MGVNELPLSRASLNRSIAGTAIRQETERQPPAPTRDAGSLRSRILAFVGGLIILSVLGSAISLYRITEVNRILDGINRVSVPLGRLLTQVQSDADLYHREFERSLGSSHWKDPHWRPHPVPRWVTDVLESELGRVGALIAKGPDGPIGPNGSVGETDFKDWAASITGGLVQLKAEADRLEQALERGDAQAASQSYLRWSSLMDGWTRQLQWGSTQYDRLSRHAFSLAESRVSELRGGLEMILVAVVCLSLMLLWLGERALRPLNELTRLAREIARRGLKKEDKSLLPEISLHRTDEVSQLAREFHHMATALLEREKTVEAQKHRLLEQNSLLRGLGELNENVLNSIEGILIVTDLSGAITQCNPVAETWLDASADRIRGTHFSAWPRLRAILEAYPEAVQWLSQLEVGSHERFALRPALMAAGSALVRQALAGRIYGGHLMPLRTENAGVGGAIWVLDDLTEELDLQERLRRAENMANMGRMSAQVAHEVRNPLHSIGLEAEMGVELAGRLGSAPLKQSLQSILAAVDRLEKITENYLKLSRLSTGNKSPLDLGEVLEAVLATYSPVCEARRVRVDWARQPEVDLTVRGDRDLLEQALGNLFRNSLQALEQVAGGKIGIALGAREGGAVWLRISDNGPGIPEEVRERLFVPFVTTRAQGTGLGLSFVKRVIEEHGGMINFVSVAGSARLDVASTELAGACFELVLPAPGVALDAGETHRPQYEIIHGTRANPEYHS